ncbi:hypothetical protein H5410_006079, partial [Solanum commersonii]
MTSFESSSKLPISQEVENPSSFNFSILHPDESPSTPICGVSEMDESITPLTEVMASYMFPSEDILACSPTLVLSGEKSQNLKAQYVAKPSVKPLSKEIEVGSMAISSTMFERLLEGDLTGGKGPESCILAAGAELGLHRDQLRFDQTPRSFDAESDKEEEEEEGQLPEEPTSTHMPIGTSETGFNDINVNKTGSWKIKTRKGARSRVQKQSEEKEMTREERITIMENQKVLNGRVFDPDILTKFGMSNPFDAIYIQGWNHLFESPVSYLHEPEVREFFHKMELLESGGITTTVRDVEICLDEELLGIILGVPVERIRSIERCKPSSDFTILATKCGDVKHVGLPKSFAKGNINCFLSSSTRCWCPELKREQWYQLLIFFSWRSSINLKRSTSLPLSTMVTAGVFMIARCSPLFEYPPTALIVITFAGAMTSFLA